MSLLKRLLHLHNEAEKAYRKVDSRKCTRKMKKKVFK